MKNNTVTCDICKKTANEPVFMWYELDCISDRVMIIGEKYIWPMHFCSFECLYSYVKDEHRRKWDCFMKEGGKSICGV